MYEVGPESQSGFEIGRRARATNGVLHLQRQLRLCANTRERLLGECTGIRSVDIDVGPYQTAKYLTTRFAHSHII